MRFETSQPKLPALRVEVTGGRRLLIRQSGRVVLLGRQRAQHRGVHFFRTNRFTSPLPHITAAQAREIRGERWTHQFASWLRDAGEGPLHDGDWTLAWGMPRWSVAKYWTRLYDVDRDLGHITWFGYGDPEEDARDILPLRRLSAPDADRVRAFRRQHREGVLPPVLLWWVSGLNALLVLDGHDRLTAALAENAVPDVVVLAPTVHPQWVVARSEWAVRAYEERMAYHGHDIGFLGQRLADEINALDRTEAETRAWLLSGGREEWDRLATELAPGSPLHEA
ncbi:hypothetical protein AB0M02_39225 [Actinoplanes sp. NPDC051861]|uniref:hypothetical protein n=1 Tax=Actinoplanes sp. NPDC051861 TaxID=3155170 RepID=UPI00342576DC